MAPIKRSAFDEAFRQDEYRKYKAILENSPGTGLTGGMVRSHFGSTKPGTRQYRLKEPSVGDRSSLFETPLISPAISKTKYNRQFTTTYAQRISNQSTAIIPGNVTLALIYDEICLLCICRHNRKLYNDTRIYFVVVNLDDEDDNNEKQRQSATKPAFVPKTLGKFDSNYEWRGNFQFEDLGTPYRATS